NKGCGWRCGRSAWRAEKSACQTSALQGLEEDLEEEDQVRRPVAQWTVSEVCSWLRRGHAISGKALLRLTDETLERMGVAPWSLRQELLREVLHLRIQQEMKDLLDITGGEDGHPKRAGNCTGAP
uniref:SAM domain-containing protein n=1 Tax=Podarcis muralis TaxID=64176 RepID=A0A670HMQ7_PODMU